MKSIQQQLPLGVSEEGREAEQKQSHVEETLNVREALRQKQNKYNRERYHRLHPNAWNRRPNGSRITKEFILQNITKTESGCWVWKRTLSKGYGRVLDGDKYVQIHRAAFELWVGPIPENLFACHRCDNRACCNPDHIFPGTQNDNMQDCVEKGRHVVGNRKLSNEQMMQIKQDQRPTEMVAESYGVSKRTIRRVRCGIKISRT